ncbi:WD40-repeat-containing domain protein [Xylaria venustula]|nr:WD40-repeat-containing domain protein [Xylaria venustula]
MALTGSLTNDIALPSDNNDTIQSLSWSRVANHLAVASWDGRVRIYDAASKRGVAALTAEAPVFSCDWCKDGSLIVAGGADKKIHVMDVATGQQKVIGSHKAPVRGVRFANVPGANGPVVVSGSWDKTVKIWDMRQEPRDAVATLSVDERVYSLDAKEGLLVVATADLLIHLIDLKNPTKIFKVVQSPLKHQTKAVAAFPDGKGWATASIEGRCGINSLDDEEAKAKDFTFCCHRDVSSEVTKIWAVNDVQFHPVHTSTLVTAGSDGTFCFWNRGAHQLLCSFPNVSSPGTPEHTGKAPPAQPSAVTAISFNHDGTLLAYAVGYDWSRGCVGNTPRTETRVMLHAVSDATARPRIVPSSLGGSSRRYR